MRNLVNKKWALIAVLALICIVATLFAVTTFSSNNVASASYEGAQSVDGDIPGPPPCGLC